MRHELDIDRPVLASSNNLFQGLPLQVIFVHLVSCNSALFLAPFLLHVVVSLIFIFSVPRQIVLLSTLPKFLHYFCGQKGCTQMFFRKILPRMISIVFILFLMVKISLPYKIMGTASAISDHEQKELNSG